MFQQAASPTARHERGLGIGLARGQPARPAARRPRRGALGGLGSGSTFTVWLPLHSARPAAGTAAAATTARCRAGLRVLVIDDDRENTETLADLLRLEGVVP